MQKFGPTATKSWVGIYTFSNYVSMFDINRMVSKLEPYLHLDDTDLFTWKWSNNNIFTTKSLYHFLNFHDIADSMHSYIYIASFHSGRLSLSWTGSLIGRVCWKKIDYWRETCRFLWHISYAIEQMKLMNTYSTTMCSRKMAKRNSSSYARYSYSH